MAGETSDELKSLTERFEKAPDSRLFAPLADAHRKNGDIDKAIELCEKGLERYPEYASARVILGKCFYDKGATERARSEFERVLDIDPENMVALKFMGEICLAENDKKKAGEFYKKLLAIDPTNEGASKMLEELQSEFEVKEIDLADKKRVRDERPGELATMTLAGIYTAQGYYNKALKIYQDILRKEPENVEVQGMVEKLQSLLDSSDAERDLAFGAEGVDVSIEEVGDELTPVQEGDEEGEQADQEPSEERGFILIDKEEAKAKGDEGGPEESPDSHRGSGEVEGHPEEEAPRPKREEKKTDAEKDDEDEDASQNKENFQAWLRKLKGD